MNTSTLKAQILSLRHRRLLWAGMALFAGLLLALVALQGAAASAVAQDLPASLRSAEAISSYLGDDEPDRPLATDLQVDTSVNVEKVRPGGFLTYTLRYTNTKLTAISSVVITDRLSSVGSRHIFTGTYKSTPPISTANFSFSENAAINGYNLRWTIPSVAANSHGEIIFYTKVVTIPEPSIKKDVMFMGNTVRIYADGQPGITGNYDQDNSAVAGPLFSLTKSVVPGLTTGVYPGRMVTYTITVVNNDRSADSWPAATQTITDFLPANTTFAWADNGGTYDAVKNLVYWNIPNTLGPGSQLTLKFGVTVDVDVDSGLTIANAKAAYRVISPELQAYVIGDVAANTKVLPVLQKTVVDSTGGTVSVFPSELVTYTVKVVNPLNQPLTGVVVTDTMPGYPMPFIYVDEVGTAPVPQQFEGGRYLRWTINLLPYETRTWSFVAQVPQQIDLSNGAASQGDNTTFTFGNALKATHPLAYFSEEVDLAKVKVNTAITMKKTVAPTRVLSGGEVVYAIELENKGPFIITNLRITDTLPADFTYVRMENGPTPLTGYTINPIVWTGLTLNPGDKFTMQVVVKAVGPWLSKNYNYLYGASPDAFVPDLYKVAMVTIDPPITIGKTVDPVVTYRGAIIDYDLTLGNVSEEIWTIRRITDDLPPGFYQVGGSNVNVAVIDVTPDYALSPDSTWEGSFQARVRDVDCNSLPKTFPNSMGAITVELYAPGGEQVDATNAAAMAPVTVIPNVNVTLTPYRQVIQSGTLVTYTLKLENVSPLAITGSTVALTLPSQFEYVQYISGPTPFTRSGVKFTWNNLSIPETSTLTAVIQVNVPVATALGTYKSTLTASASGVCYGKLQTGDVQVVDEIVKFTLKAPIQVSPSTMVDYEISILNRDKYSFLLTQVRNVLPLDFTYKSMIQGPTPNSAQGQRQIWNNFTLPPGTTKWILRSQAAPLYGLYTDRIGADSLETYIYTSTHSLTVLPVVDLVKDSPVTLGAVGMYIPYTITVINQSSTNLVNVVITDTLPAGFIYNDVLGSTPLPAALGPNEAQPVWTVEQLKAGQSLVLAFNAFILPGVVPGTYYNTVAGDSDTGVLPGPIFAAPIEVTPNSLVQLLYMPVLFKK